MKETRKHLSFAIIPRKVLDSFNSKIESRALRVFNVLTMYYSVFYDEYTEETMLNRPFIGHNRIAKILNISKSQVKIDLKILSNIEDEDGVPILVIHNRFDKEENRYLSNVYELPQVEEILKNFKTRFEF